MKANMNGATIVSCFILFSLIWWILTGGAAASWWIGVPAVLLALTASTVLVAPVHLVWVEFLRFVPFFLLRSLMGGADVAWRAFHPGMPIEPDLIEYTLRLPSGLPQVFMVNTINLLPGTLVAELDRSVLKVHVLNGRKDFLAELDMVEQHVARMFNTPMKLAGGGK